MRFQDIYPESDSRLPILNILSESIEAANSENPAGWSISLRGGGSYVNLIVGRIFALSLKKDGLWVTLDDSSLSDDVRSQVLRVAVQGPLYDFASVPSAKTYVFDAPNVPRVWPLIEDAHKRTLQEAAASVSRTPYHRALDEDLLDEIDEELETDLPHPIYEGGGLTDAKVQELVKLVNSRFPGWTGFSDPAFVDDEIDYKREVVNLAAELLSESEFESLLESESFDQIIERLESVGKKSNLLFLSVPTSGDLNILYREDLDRPGFCVAVFDLLHGTGDGSERLTRYLDWVDKQGIPRSHNKWTFPTYFIFFLHPDDEIFVKPSIVREFIKLAGLEFGLGSRPAGDTYAAIRDAYREIGERLADFGPRDMIDLQSFVWVAVRASREAGDQKELLEKARAELRRLQGTTAFRFSRRLRQHRSGQIQALLSNPHSVTLDSFNRDVWRFLTSATLDGRDVSPLFRRHDLTDKELADLNAGLDTGGLELHGNLMWGTGSNTFGPMLRLRAEPGSELEAIVSVLERAAGELEIDALLNRARELEGGASLTRAALEELILDNADYLESESGNVRLIPDDEVRERYVRAAVSVLNDPELNPEEKTQKLLEIPGIGLNIATGLVMVFHPDEFGHYNQPSRAAVERLGLPAKDLPTFQRSLTYLREELEATDFLELDYFLWMLAHDLVSLDGSRRSGIWWANQGNSYESQRDHSYIWAPTPSKEGRPRSSNEAVGRVLPGDRILHVSGGEIRAIGTVMERPVEERDPAVPDHDASQDLGYHATVAYEELKTPVAVDALSEEWRKAESGPFTSSGRSRSGYLFPLAADSVALLAKDHTEIGELLDLDWMDPAWLFQASPGLYDLAAELERKRHGDEDYWSVATLGKEMKEGDQVYLWLAGKEAGVYATGRITGAVYEREAGEWHGDKAGELIPVVPFQYDEILSRPLPRDEVLRDPILRDMHVIRAPTGTNFRVTAEENRRLRELIQSEDGIVTDLDEIHASLTTAGMRLGLDVLRRYHSSLRTRGFVVLAGLSGSGKTWLTQLYAKAIGARYKLVPVAPNWTTNEDLLGYFNPLTHKYHDTPFSRFLREASDEYRRATEAGEIPVPYHVALDEMNLARIEYYFARFLSAMELRARHGTAEIELGPDDIVLLPPNLFFVGTVNVDETTHGFADKVYDRAQLIELDAPRHLLAEHMGDAPYAASLLKIWDAVAPVAPFAFRVLDEVDSYVTGAADFGVAWEEALDEQIVQKVLPKLKGADPRVADVLESLIALSGDKFPLTRAKAEAMNHSLAEYGFTSFF